MRCSPNPSLANFGIFSSYSDQRHPHFRSEHLTRTPLSHKLHRSLLYHSVLLSACVTREHSSSVHCLSTERWDRCSRALIQLQHHFLAEFTHQCHGAAKNGSMATYPTLFSVCMLPSQSGVQALPSGLVAVRQPDQFPDMGIIAGGGQVAPALFMSLP